MDRFDILGTLKAYCTTNNIVFLCGEQWMQNYEATQAEINPGQLILGADFKPTMTYKNGQITEIRYTGGLILGRKDETLTDTVITLDETLTDTVSTLDETYWDKYVNRLQELSELMAVLIASIACDNELDCEGISFAPELNKFDTNIDFIAATLTFVQ